MAGANCSRRAAGVQFGAAQGGSAAEQGLGGFCQLVRVVRPLYASVFAQPNDVARKHANEKLY